VPGCCFDLHQRKARPGSRRVGLIFTDMPVHGEWITVTQLGPASSRSILGNLHRTAERLRAGRPPKARHPAGAFDSPTEAVPAGQRAAADL
jgi:hypothetical protein